MPRQKRSSTVLDTAHKRLAGLTSITPAPDFGAALSVSAYTTQINNFSIKLDKYNEMIAALDQFQNELEADEERLRDTNKRVLSAAEAHYGSDSSEYEQVGGTRLSERKRPTRKAPKPTA